MPEIVKKRKTGQKKVYSGAEARYGAEEVSSVKSSDWQCLSVLAYLRLSRSLLRTQTAENFFVLLVARDRQTLSMLRITTWAAMVPPTNCCGPQLYKYAFILHIDYFYVTSVFQPTMLLYIKALVLLL